MTDSVLCRIIIMEMQLAVLLLCVLKITEGFPVSIKLESNSAQWPLYCTLPEPCILL